MLSLLCNPVNCTNCCFLYPRMGPSYLNTPLYGGSHVFEVVQTGQTKHLWSLNNWRHISHVWKGNVRWGFSAATCNFTARCHKILHTEPLTKPEFGKIFARIAHHFKLNSDEKINSWSVHIHMDTFINAYPYSEAVDRAEEHSENSSLEYHGWLKTAAAHQENAHR